MPPRQRRGEPNVLERRDMEQRAAELFREAMEIVKAGKNVADALPLLDEAVKLRPRVPRYYYVRGNINRLVGRHQRAFYDYGAAIRLDDTDPAYFCARGLCHRKLRRFPEALEDFAVALELDPSDGQIFFYRGLVRFELGEYEVAREDFSRALEHEHTGKLGYRALFNRAQCHRKMGRLRMAQADLRTALTLDGTTPAAYESLASVLCDQGEFEEALSALGRALEASPSHSGLLVRRAMCLYNMRRFSAALGDLDVALRSGSSGEDGGGGGSGSGSGGGAGPGMGPGGGVDDTLLNQSSGMSEDAPWRSSGLGASDPEALVLRASIQLASRDVVGALRDAREAVRWLVSAARAATRQGDEDPASSKAKAPTTTSSSGSSSGSKSGEGSKVEGERAAAAAEGAEEWSRPSDVAALGDRELAVLAQAETVAGLAFQVQADFESAKARFAQAMLACPALPGPQYHYGLMLHAAGHTEEAHEQLSRALAAAEHTLAAAQAVEREEARSLGLQDPTAATPPEEEVFDEADDRAAADAATRRALRAQRVRQSALRSARLRRLHRARGLLRQALGRHSDAITDFTAALSLTPGRGSILYDRAVSWLQTEPPSLRQAVLDLLAATRNGFDTAEVWDKVATAQILHGPSRLQAAVEAYGEALRRSPGRPALLCRRAQCLRELGDSAAAEADLTAAVAALEGGAAAVDVDAGKGGPASGETEADPLDDVLGVPRAMVAGKSAVVMPTVTSASLSRARLLYLRGLCRYDQDMYDGAIDDFGAALDHAPSPPEAGRLQFALGIAFANSDRHDRAVPCFSAAIDAGDHLADDERLQAVHERAKSLQMLGRHSDAVRDFSHVLQLNPGNAHALFRRAFSYKALRKYAEAASDFEDAKVADPTDPNLAVNYRALHNVAVIVLCAAGEEPVYDDKKLPAEEAVAGAAPAKVAGDGGGHDHVAEDEDGDGDGDGLRVTFGSVASLESVGDALGSAPHKVTRGRSQRLRKTVAATPKGPLAATASASLSPTPAGVRGLGKPLEYGVPVPEGLSLHSSFGLRAYSKRM